MKTKNCFRIHGQVSGAKSKGPLSGLIVQAFDKDLLFDDRLGTATTDAKGRFDIRYEESDFSDFFERRPDIYLRVRDADGTLLLTTEDQVRYQADTTERFLIEIPESETRIGDAETLRRRIVDDPALQRELAEAVSGLLDGKGLLHDGLACTFVPVMAPRAATSAGLFVTALGPQPEPPDKRSLADQIRAVNKVDPQPEPPLPRWLKELGQKPEPVPWMVRWWWIGLPLMELLRRLDLLRLAAPDSTTGLAPAYTAAGLAYRIMSDRSLGQGLSLRIEQVLTRNGVAIAPQMDLSLVPVVYTRPMFAGEVMAVSAAAPGVYDYAGNTSVPAWFNPLEGVPPAELLVQLAAHQMH
jgi:hypothetical protein